ncbi:MAG: copper resistance protein CopB, partial [Burkholderiales bacterium 21-58-4]
MNIRLKKKFLVVAIATACLTPIFAHAQTYDAHSGHTAAPASPATGGAKTPGMDHGAMQMQGGSAPPDARDPNAYSGGYTLDAGKYSLGSAQRLRMSDEHNFASVLVDRLEYVRGTRGNESMAYEGQAWFGGTYNRAVLKAEGEVARGKLLDSRTELLWGHAISTFWDSQLGVRFDHGIGPNRGWLAFGVQGLAPYWFNVDATAYVGNSGRTALRLSTEYDLL